jgi:RimJ/RimL family protein N-acetyltransferase
MALGPTLQTERLILRPPEQGDLDAWAELFGNPESARFIGGARTRPESWRTLALVTGMWPLRGFGTFAVVEKATGACVGSAGPWQPEGWPGTEVGWSLVRSRWGRGYATEAASACLDWVFDELGWTEVIHCIDPQNAASAAVARRLGSQVLRMARMPPPFADHECQIWGQTREAWRARPAAL